MDDYLYKMNRFKEESTTKNSRASVQNPAIDERLSQELRRAIHSTRQFFFDHQHPDGHWVGELEGDARLQSETILLLAFLGEEDSELAKECSRHLLDTQLDDGGWGRYAEGKSDVSNTVKAYFALKLTGHDPGTDFMQRAGIRALELGGADRIDRFSRFYLALLGQIPYDVCPVIPTQIMLLPKRFSVNLYSMSRCWRTVFVPLSIVSALTPVRHVPSEKGIRELFVEDPRQWPTDRKTTTLSGNFSDNSSADSRNLFCRMANGTMKLMRLCRRVGWTPMRKKAIDKAKAWMLEHCRRSGGSDAIYPSIVWTWIALKTLKYGDDSEEIGYCRRQLNDLVIRDEKRGSARIQPCKSPVWDTSQTLKALMLGGLTTSHPAVRKGVRWMRLRHIGERGGWCFEFDNDFYSDCDDTATALMVLAGRFDETGTALPDIPSSKRKQDRKKPVLREHDERFAASNPKSGILPPDLRLMVGECGGSLDEAKRNVLDLAETTGVLENGLRWLLAMQNKDGGWAAFDSGNNREFLRDIPFADHVDRIDPSAPDLTGRVLESLGSLGFRVGQNIEVDRAVRYLKREQRPDGSWFGRWGVHCLYGTWQALTGLAAVGVSKEDQAITAGANWLLTHQHPCGGWGESPDFHADPSLRGRGKPTPSQTAWAVMGLIAAGLIDHPAVQRGIRFLLDRQRKDGTWYEAEYTGTGFSPFFCLKHHYYPVYFPLMALSLYAAKTKVPNVELHGEQAILRLHRIRAFSPETCNTYNNTCGNTGDNTHADARLEEESIPPESSIGKISATKKSACKPALRIFLG